MGKKTALVLSGGGTRGAFQYAAEKYAREVKGYKWDVIAGVSVGALNATFLAMEKYSELEKLWRTISKNKVYTGNLNFLTIIKLLFGKKHIYSNEPLWKIIDKEVDPSKINLDLRIGTVSLETGKYKIFKPEDPDFKKAVLASTNIPIRYKPINISKDHRAMVDGGLRNISPLGDVLDAGPDEVIIINCNPREPEKIQKPFKNILDIGRRSIDIAINEIFNSDLREFIRINNNIKEASKRRVKLHNENKKEFKYFNFKIIEPSESLGDTFDFSKETIERQMKAGWNKAKEVLG